MTRDPTPSARSRRRWGIAVLVLACALSIGVALGAPADVDRGFGRDGAATADAGGSDYGNALAVQPDGKIVVAGETSLNNDAAVFRLNSDGSPDRGFDDDGARTIDGGGTEEGHAVAIQPDGRIVVAGQTSVGLNAAVYRLNPDGSPDTSFDLDGARAIDSGGYEYATAVALQTDGKIVVTGYTSVNTSGAVYRLNPNGSPDTSFDLDGARGIDMGGGETANAVAIQPDGKIVVAGASTFNNDDDAFSARFLVNGAPDTGFGGGDGVASIETGADDYAHAVALQPDGKIVMAGYTQFNNDVTVYRLTPAGSLDPAFGTGGIVRLDRGDYEEAFALALQPDGKILVAGETSVGDDALVYRLLPDGSRDVTFGGDGSLVLGGSGLEQARAIALQGDGKILLAGDNSAAATDVLVYRLLGDSRTPAGPAVSAVPAGPVVAAGPAGPIARPGAVARCAGRRATIVGTARSDRIRGTRGPDVIAGLSGNDVIRGLGGDDVICGGAGRDVVRGGAGRDRLIGGAGPDRLIGGPGKDRLIGGPGKDRLIGGPGRDAVTQ